MAENPPDARYKRTEVYLEDRYDKPKHLFLVIADKVRAALGAEGGALLDVGGASGELAYHLKKTVPGLDITAVDVDPELIERARKRVQGCRFEVCGAEDMSIFPEKSFDLVTMVGVLSIFDDFARPIEECLRVAKDGGTLIILSLVNEFPVDALVRWRYSADTGPHNLGYNLHSKESLARFLKTRERVDAWSFEKFRLPFDLPRQEDPIRTWTELDRDGKRVFRNGLQMEINLQFLEIRLKAPDGHGAV